MKFAAASPKRGLHKKGRARDKQATLDELQPNIVSENRNRAAIDNATKVNNTSNTVTKANESDLANNFPQHTKHPMQQQ